MCGQIVVFCLFFLILNKEYGVPFMETSAKTGVNVELAFLAIARQVLLYIYKKKV